MINQKMFALGKEPSAIRQLFAYGLERKAQIGAENVFDYSIGNPSVPTPHQVTQAIRDLTDLDPVAVHGYTPTTGDPERVPQSLSRWSVASAGASLRITS